MFLVIYGIPKILAAPSEATTTLTSTGDFDGGNTTDTVTTGNEVKLAGGADNWWDNNYQYRRQLTVTNNSAGTAAVGTVATITINTSTLQTAGKVRADRNDWRVVYWNGASNEELDRIYESASSTKFAIQTTIAGSGGSSSDYYVYYGYASESTSPPSMAGSVNKKLSLDTTPTQVVTSGVRNHGIATDGNYLYMSSGSQVSKLNLNGTLVGTKTVALGGDNKGLGFAGGRIIGRNAGNLYAYDWDTSTLTQLNVPPSKPLLYGESWLNQNLATDPEGLIGTMQYTAGGLILRRYTISGNDLTWLDDISLSGTYHTTDNHGFTMSEDYVVFITYAHGWRRWHLPDGAEEVDLGGFGGTGTNTETHPSGMSNPTFIDYNWKTGVTYVGDYDSSEFFSYPNESVTVSPTLVVTDSGETGSLAASGEYTTNGVSTSDESFLNFEKMYEWGNGTGDSATAFSANVTIDTPANATITFSIRSASTTAGLTSATWYEIGSPTSTGNYTRTKSQMDALNGGSGIIPSGINKYYQLKIELTSSDGLTNPSVQDVNFTYFQDNDKPSANPTVAQCWDSASKTTEYISTDWHNDSTIYCEWSDDATDDDSSITGYYVTYTTDDTTTPVDDGTRQDARSFSLTATESNESYYLRIQAHDFAGNVIDNVAELFEYRYDATNPVNPAGITPNPAGFSSNTEFDFTWSIGSDTGGSGVSQYCYKTGDPTYAGDTGPGTDTCVSSAVTTATDIPKYKDGSNIFYVRTKDTAGNMPTFYTQTQYFYAGDAPTPPQGLTVDPTSVSPDNSFTFEWFPPASYSPAIKGYYYSINQLPSAETTSYTTLTSVGPGAYATQQGSNLFYVVAQDTADNIEWTSYAQVEFQADTTAPGIPTSVTITDSSIRAESKYLLTITWNEPSEVGSGIDHYVIERSTEIGCATNPDPDSIFTELATTSAEGYLDSGLSNTTTYCYRIKASDNAGATSEASSIVSMVPEGKYTEPPTLIVGPEVQPLIQSAMVTWETDREGSSFVEFGPTDALGRILGQDDFVTEHSVQLLDLDPDTTYYYRVKFTDQDGNIGYSSISTFDTADAPSAPVNLAVTPSVNTQNSFAFSWDPPADEGVEIKGYYYSVNATPLESNTSYTTLEKLSAGPYATQQGINVFYVVAMDSDNNINFNNYASVEFQASTPAPAIPTGIIITDASNRETEDYSIALKWSKVTLTSGGTVTYHVYRSIDGENFTAIAQLQTTGYLDVDLDNTTEYFYYVKASDDAGSMSVASTIASEIPEGRYTTPPAITKGPLATPDSFSCLVTWDTERETTSFVQYGLFEGLGEEQGESDLISEHINEILGLNPENTYYYRVKSVDVDGNIALSPIKTFTTLEAPRVSDVLVSDIKLYDALVTWTTNKDTTSRIDYGDTISYGSVVYDTSNSLTKSHTLKLTGLVDGTTYHFRPTGEDANGNPPESGDYSFQTLTFPEVLEVSYENKSEGQTEIKWTTNVPTTSIVEYYNDQIAPKTQGNQAYTKEHSVLLFGLEDATIYQYRVKGTDQFGYSAQSEENEFITLEDTTPPEIFSTQSESNTIGSGETSTVQIVVSWKTDEPTTSQVEYGVGLAGAEYTDQTEENAELVMDHLVVISSLTPAKTYHFRVVSSDKANNQTKSGSYTVLTTRKRESFLQLIISNLEETFSWIGAIGNLGN